MSSSRLLTAATTASATRAAESPRVSSPSASAIGRYRSGTAPALNRRTGLSMTAQAMPCGIWFCTVYGSLCRLPAPKLTAVCMAKV